MPTSPDLRSLAAIVFTDIVGYSALVHRDDANALRLVEEHFRLVREIAGAFGGRVIKTIGDSVHLEFASAQTATSCAMAIQQKHQHRNAQVAEDQRFDIRIGIHLGDIEHRGGDTYGDGVNIAARLQPLAPVGGLAVSDDVRRQLPEELRGQFKSLGAQPLKNIATPVEAFVLEAGAIAGIAVEAPAAARPRGKPQLSWLRYVAAALVIASLVPLAGMFVATLPFLHKDKPASPADSAASEKSIAVLPFTDLSAARDQEYFADGMAEELLNSLAKIKDLKVAGRTSSFSFKGRNEDLRMIGKALAVANVLEGSVRKQGDKVRITAQLIQVADGYHLWSETYDRELKDIFAVQTEIATAVAEQLKITLFGNDVAPRAKPDAPPNGDVEAYQAVLQGNFHFERQNPEDLRKAIDFYERAIRLEPDYALAHAKLARATTLLGGFFGGFTSAEYASFKARTLEAANAAVRLGPDLAEAHVAKCQAEVTYELAFAAAAAECERAYELAPQDASAVLAYGALNATMGRIEEALKLSNRAIALDPLSARAYVMAGRFNARLGNYEKAESLIRKALEVQPEFAGANGNLAGLRARLGHAEEAVELAKREKTDFWRTFALAIVYHVNGNHAEADAALKKMSTTYATDGAYQVAEIYARRGEPDKAFEWLERAWALRDPGAGLILADNFFAPYEKDPRFIAYAKKIGVMP